MPKYMKKKRTYRRRRKSYRKKRGISRALGINKVKYSSERLTGFVEIKSTSDQVVNLNYNVAWMQTSGIVQNVYGFNSSPRWDQIKFDYEQIAITGMKVEYIPTNARGLVYGGAAY